MNCSVSDLPAVFALIEDAASPAGKKRITSALEAGITGLIVPEKDAHLPNPGRFTVLSRSGDSLFSNGQPAGRIYHISSAKALLEVEDSGGIAVIETEGWRVLPLENLISRLKQTKIYVLVKTPEEAELAAEILEKGCAGVVISADAESQEGFTAARQEETISLTPAVISKIAQVPLSDRVCIDTTSILDADEGMLIGSSSACLFLICSENAGSEYTAPRPFRVNAGAVHSYILLPGGKTAYLSELSAGSLLLSRKVSGTASAVTVGRIKIEKRPMLLISAEVRTADAPQISGSVIVQNAETIRLLTPDGPVSVADLSEGDTVLVRTAAGGRHFGMPVDETVREL